MNSLVLFSQAAAKTPTLLSYVTWAAIAFGLLLVSIVAITGTVQGIGFARRVRELEHAERMKAMELGRLMPGEGKATRGSLAMAMGVGVPLGVFAISFVASLVTHQETIWIAAGMVGLASVIGGLTLAKGIPADSEPARAEHLSANGKPEFDPDSYDVVSQRG